MSILDSLIGILAPHECVGCGREGNLLCPACRTGLQPAPAVCYRCQRYSPGSVTCADCGDTLRPCRVRAGTRYDGNAKTLVWQLKSSGAQAAARDMAANITARHRITPVNPRIPTYLVPLPTATTRARQRGYDQAYLLARELGRQTGIPCRQLLIRRGQSHQVGASRRQRLAQLQGAFRVKRNQRLNGAHIILIDDIATTGATIEAATSVLVRAGAGPVEAVVFAQTPA